MLPIKTLIIEDDPVWIAAMKMALQDHVEFGCMYVEDIPSALDALKQEKFDLIVLDLVLPNSSALETLKTISTVASTTPIVVTTTICDQNTKHEAFLCGIQDFIIKNEFTIETFVHASLTAVQRLSAILSVQEQKNLELIASHLSCLKNLSDARDLIKAQANQIQSKM